MGPWYQRKGATTRNTLVKYESSITSHSKVMANVKVFGRQTDRLTDGIRTICLGSVSMQGIKMPKHPVQMGVEDTWKIQNIKWLTDHYVRGNFIKSHQIIIQPQLHQAQNPGLPRAPLPLMYSMILQSQASLWLWKERKRNLKNLVFLIASSCFFKHNI